MSRKVLLDNNVGDRFDELSPREKDDFVSCFRGGRFSHYLNDSLLLEVVRIGRSPERCAMFARRIRWLLSLQGRFLLDGNEIIESELSGETRLFEDAGEARMHRDVLEQVATVVELGKALPPREDDGMGMFRNSYLQLKGQQERFRRMIGHPGEAKKDYPTYASFRESWAWPRLHEYLTNVFVGFNLDRTQIPKVIAYPDRYPYLLTHIEIVWAKEYLTFVEDMRVGEGDIVDTHYLLYMRGLDLFVTDDKRLIRLFLLVYPQGKEVLRFSEFMPLVRA